MLDKLFKINIRKFYFIPNSNFITNIKNYNLSKTELIAILNFEFISKMYAEK